jgi:hypothetical protein
MGRCVDEMEEVYKTIAKFTGKIKKNTLMNMMLSMMPDFPEIPGIPNIEDIAQGFGNLTDLRRLTDWDKKD